MALLMDVIKCDGLYSVDRDLAYMEAQCFLDCFVKTDSDKEITPFELNALTLINKHFPNIVIAEYVDIDDETTAMYKRDLTYVG